MDPLAFIASLVGSLAWPVAMAVIVVVFRRQFRAILNQPITKVKAGIFEAEWEAHAASVKDEVRSEPKLGAAASPAAPLVRERLAPVVEWYPSAAVLQAFAEVEQALRARLLAAGRDVPGAGAAALSRELHHAGLISRQTVEAVRNLSVLRNLAAHSGDDMRREHALEFLALADGVLAAIAANQLPDALTKGSKHRESGDG